VGSQGIFFFPDLGEKRAIQILGVRDVVVDVKGQVEGLSVAFAVELNEGKYGFI